MKKLLKITFTLIIIIILLLGFALPVNPPNGTWYQQFFPNLNGRVISDITFIDSLNGFAVTRLSSTNDTNYILKSTNSGDNWSIVYRQYTSSIAPFNKIKFLNKDTGFVGGNNLLKTTNAGINWISLPLPAGSFSQDFFALNEDSIWFADFLPFDGGLFRSTNKGLNWERQYDAGSAPNPDHVYMYNGRIGFMTRSGSGTYLYKTTTSGANWFTIPGGTWLDIKFIDSLTGWKADQNGVMAKTVDGGNNWTTQILPSGGNFFSTGIINFTILNLNTILGTGGMISNGGIHRRGVIYKTTNGGINWLYQVPDTSFSIGIYYKILFLNQYIGWVYGMLANSSTENRMIHTTNGGDTTFLIGLQQLSSEIPKQFILIQNYPNPFNPVTNIGFRIAGYGLVTLKIFEVTGREVITLINEELRAGEYKTDWNAFEYSSGIYFYKLTVTSGKGVFTDTKKMILIK